MQIDQIELYGMEQLPIVMVVEDDQDIQNVVEDALIDGGFEAALVSSGERR